MLLKTASTRGAFFLLAAVLVGAAVPTPCANARSIKNSTSTASPSTSTSLSSTDSSMNSTSSSMNGTSTSVNGTSTPSNSTSNGGGNYLIYTDAYVEGVLPDPSKVEGFNVIALSFLLASGAADQAQAWEQMDSSKRTSMKQKYSDAGIKIIVSAFGSTEKPTTTKEDPTSVASQMAAWVKKYGVDGIDVDWEDDAAFDKGDGSGEKWLETFTTILRQELPSPYLLTHAPQAPWFSKSSYKAGAYTTVHAKVGHMIDWYNIQYYNQGDGNYEKCDDTITSSSAFPGTAILEMMNAGYPQNMLVIGKPGTKQDAGPGFMSTTMLSQCVSLAKSKGWNAGVMVWEYPDASADWLKKVLTPATN